MNKLRLVLPNKKYLKSYQNFCRDFIKNGTTDEYRKGYEKQLASSRKPLFLKWLHDDSKGVNLEKGMVPMTTYWAMVNNKVVGRINIRHKLNKELRTYGGHIGYAVRSDEQGKGYATEMLRQVLLKAKKIGLTKVLITCKVSNTGSRKVIENNGGILKTITPHGDRQQCLYWIKL